MNKKTQNNILKILIIGLSFIISPTLMAQQIITGRISDADDGTPIVDASIFIANTTVGTISDASGQYSLTVPGSGSFEIVVSHAAYQSVFRKIDTPKDAHRYDVVLKTTELEEVAIQAKKTYNNKDIELFWRMLLGEKPSKKGMQVLNPEKVWFFKSNNVLKATCREPIEIVNHLMGYRIRYVLQSFILDYGNNGYEIAGMPYFEELTPANSRQKDNWEKKRQEVYSISMNRFLRAINRKKIHEEGFLLINKDLLMKGKIESA